MYLEDVQGILQLVFPVRGRTQILGPTSLMLSDTANARAMKSW